MEQAQLDGIADNLEQLALLSKRGNDVSHVLEALAKIVRGTHEPSPEGLVPVSRPAGYGLTIGGVEV